MTTIKSASIEKFRNNKRCGQCEGMLTITEINRDEAKVSCSACGDNMGIISVNTVHIRNTERGLARNEVKRNARKHGFSVLIGEEEKPEEKPEEILASLGF